MSSSSSYKVLCVCLGNICRSPTAEAVFRHFCELQHLNVMVDSAGTSNYHPDKAPDERSQFYAKKRGYDLSALRARQLTVQDFLDFDLILAMDFENFKNIEQLKQRTMCEYSTHTKFADVALMSEFDPDFTRQAVPDPYYGTEQDFERVLDQCESSAKAWIEQFKTYNIDIA